MITNYLKLHTTINWVLLQKIFPKSFRNKQSPWRWGHDFCQKKKNISRNLTKFLSNRQTTTKYITIYFRDPKVKLLFHNKQANQNSMRIIITKTALDTTNSTFKCISYIRWNQLKSKFYKQVKQFYIKWLNSSLPNNLSFLVNQ